MSDRKYTIIQIVGMIVVYVVSAIIFKVWIVREYDLIPLGLATIPALLYFLIIRKYLFKKFPNLKKVAHIDEKDERNIALRNQAYFYGANTTLILLLIFSMLSELVNHQLQDGAFISFTILYLSMVASLTIVFYKNKA